MSGASALDEALGTAPVLAIVRFRRPSRVAEVLAALAGAGVRAAEVTTTTPGWEAAIAAAPSGLLVGAGTVTTIDDVRRAADAGARFVVSPGFDAGVLAAAHRAGLEALPGVITATEIDAALAAGARQLKLFPAGPLGPAYLRALRGPYGDVRFVPTGGVTEADLDRWFDAGAWAVAVGSELVGRDGSKNAGEIVAIGRRAERFVAQAADRR